MTLKQISKQYGIEYSILYQGLVHTGKVKRRQKNVDYDVVTVLSACDEYCRYRIEKLSAKIADFIYVQGAVEVSLKNAFTESPPKRL